jgi:hypothetical protein
MHGQKDFLPMEKFQTVQTCIASIHDPVDKLTSNDIISYMLSGVLNTLPKRRVCPS